MHHLHVSKDYQEMMQTYRILDKSAQQKMQFSLSNKNWIRLNIDAIRQRQETLLLP
jgi:hypothetical protein